MSTSFSREMSDSSQIDSPWDESNSDDAAETTHIDSRSEGVSPPEPVSIAGNAGLQNLIGVVDDSHIPEPSLRDESLQGIPDALHSSPQPQDRNGSRSPRIPDNTDYTNTARAADTSNAHSAPNSVHRHASAQTNSIRVPQDASSFQHPSFSSSLRHQDDMMHYSNASMREDPLNNSLDNTLEAADIPPHELDAWVDSHLAGTNIHEILYRARESSNHAIAFDILASQFQTSADNMHSLGAACDKLLVSVERANALLD